MESLFRMIVEGIRLANEAVDADAELWVASRGPTALAGADVAARLAGWTAELFESNETLALCFTALRSLVQDLPADAPVDDHDWPTAGAVAGWCAYALAGVAAQRRRLAVGRSYLAAA